MPSSNGDERGPNIYAQLMRATARDNAEAVRDLLDVARHDGKLDDNLLRLGLQNCAKKGLAKAARVLLEYGAKTDVTPGEHGAPSKGSPALFWACAQPQNKGHLEVAKLLLDTRGTYPGCPADVNWKDEQGRNLVNATAWRGHLAALQLLLDHGADINARDLEDRTVLHNLAADKKSNQADKTEQIAGAKKPMAEKKGKWDHKVVSVLLGRPIQVNARDKRQRTALHWACATGKDDLTRQLIKHRKIDLNRTTFRGKTALHMACSTESDPVPEIVSLLLEAGADPEKASDGGWTCLHMSAAKQASTEIVELLLAKCPKLLNMQTSTGLTALHCAAEAGSEAVVRLLLSQSDIQLNMKDAFYTTPLLRAAQQGHTSIVEQLAPFNNVDRLSSYAVEAANYFDATIVDFRVPNSDHQNIVQKKTVFEVLYGKNAAGDHEVTTRVDTFKSKTKQAGTGPERKPRFRWIHLPANNLAWVEALIAKAFIENECSDLEGFKAVERGFSHQHRGPKSHSQYMTPLCQRSPRGVVTTEKLPLYGAMEDAIKDSSGKTRHDYQSSPERPSRRDARAEARGKGRGGNRNLGFDSGEFPTVAQQMTAHGALRALTEEPEHFSALEASSTNVENDTTEHDTPPPTAKSTPAKPMWKKGRRVKDTYRPGELERTDTNSSGATVKISASPRSMSYAESVPSNKSDKALDKPAGGGGKNGALTGSNIVYFAPFLHWETEVGYIKQREAIREAKAERGSTPSSCGPKKGLCQDEILIRAHLESSLHLRRTLDQFFLHGIDTEDRDSDQVVFRFCKANKKVEKLYMVDQLWMWILGPGLIITAFPQRWRQPKNDPLNVLDGIIEDVNSKTGAAVGSVYDLALLITNRTSGAFDRHRPGDNDYQFLDMFESSIGNVNHEETQLYRDFYKASATVHDWISRNKGEAVVSYDPLLAVDRFLDIGRETALLQEIKDIRDELGMISMVLNHQRATIPSLSDAICEDMMEGSDRRHANPRARDVRRRVEEQKRTVELHLAELERMARLSEGIEHSLLNLLDLKQKQSNAFEARFARVQAAGTVRQGQIIMVFTMVTILFLPMSFMAAFFAIPINDFPGGGGSGVGLRIGYVSKYIFGIGLGVSVLLIALAFSINGLSSLTRGMRPLSTWGRGSDVVRAADTYPYGSLSKLHTPGQELFRVGRFSTDTDNRRSMELVDEKSPYKGRVRMSASLSLRRNGYMNDIERGGT